MRDDFDELLATGSPLPVASAPPTADIVPAVVGGERAYGAYEGANRFQRDLATWQPTLASADADIIPSKPIGDARARDMLRNDAYIQGGATLHKDNIVGAQFLLNAKPASRVLLGKQDDAWETDFQEEVEELWELTAESPDNLLDASRHNTFTDMIRLVVGIHLAAGEVLASVEWKRDGRPFNTAIQMVDLDRLSTPPLKRTVPNLRAGILRDDWGVAQTYYIQKVHPRDYRPSFEQFQDRLTWLEIPARKPWGRPQIIHLFAQQRAAQTRGIAEMVAALKEMHITHKFRDVTLQNAVTQALFAASITSDMPSELMFQKLGAGTSPDEWQNSMHGYMAGYFQMIDQYCGSAKNLQVDGVRIPHLPPGSKLDMISPGKGGPLGMEFEQSLLRYIAAVLGVSYEQLSRDYTNTNYSSARAAMTETWKFMQSRKKEVADRFATMIYRLWLEEMVAKGALTTFPAAKAALLYENGALGMKFDALSRCDWIGASRGQIDELKETQAAVLRVSSGLSTYEEELARLGKDFRKVFRQIARERKMAKELGIDDLVYATDTSGMMNASTAEEPSTGKQPAGNGKKKAA